MADFKSQFPTPSPTVVTGVRATSDIVAGRIKLDVSDEIFQYDPNANSLTLLLTKARKKRSVTQYLYNWLEKDRYPRFDAVNLAAGYDENDVSIVVDDGSKFYANALILNTRTNERMLVTDVSSNTLTVTRNLGGTGSAINDNDQLEILTSAYVEGGDVGTSKSVQERMIEQFTQTIRTPYSFTGRDMNTDMYGGKDPNTERRWQGVEHAVSIEKAFWWSTKGSTTDATSGKLITYMNGVHSYVKDNVWDINDSGVVLASGHVLASGKTVTLLLTPSP